MKIQKQAFTLVEVLVTITIFSIMMISVMGVYMTSTSITYKADLNRFMQENVKNIVTNLSEDIMKNGFEGIAENGNLNNCSTSISNSTVNDKLCIHNSPEKSYFLAAKTATDGSLMRVIDKDFCHGKDSEGFRNQCFIVFNDGTSLHPITNDLVTVEDLQFYVTGSGNIPQKVTTYMTLAIAPKSGVREGLVKETKLRTQFTITVRDYMSKN